MMTIDIHVINKHIDAHPAYKASATHEHIHPTNGILWGCDECDEGDELTVIQCEHSDSADGLFRQWLDGAVSEHPTLTLDDYDWIYQYNHNNTASQWYSFPIYFKDKCETTGDGHKFYVGKDWDLHKGWAESLWGAFDATAEFIELIKADGFNPKDILID